VTTTADYYGSQVPAALKRNVLLTHCLDFDEEGSDVFVVEGGARESGNETSKLAFDLINVCIPRQRSDEYR
jgi:hypothetical protein